MSTSPPDLLLWVAEELGLSVLEDGPDRTPIRLARGAAHREDAHDLADAVARAAGLQAPDDSIRALIDGARSGGRTSTGLPSVDGGALLAWNVGLGRARVLIAPHGAGLARRAAASDLAASVTHEVANALTAIAGWARVAAEVEAVPERARHAIDVVQRSADDALESARALLASVRAPRPPQQATPPDQTLVSEVVRGVVDTLRAELEEANIRVETSLGADTWSEIAPAAVRLVVSNLSRNAFEALDGSGGRIGVSVLRVDERILISVEDDGPGMSSQTLTRAFDRYFTTKPSGSGLGLALVRDTVRDVGGRVEVDSRKGGGTRFDVWLPAAGSGPMSVRPPRVSTTSSVRPRRPPVASRASLPDERVLLLDDDVATRALLRMALESRGAHVETAESLEVALGSGPAFSLAIIDRSFGGARGEEALGLLVASGKVRRSVLLTDLLDEETSPACGADETLRKPFGLDELADVLERLLDRRSA